MKTLPALGFLVSLILTTQAVAKSHQETVPESIIKAARDFIISGGDEDHADQMITSWEKRGVFYQANISPSALPDWVIDTAKAKETYYCGTGGCETQIFSADQTGQYHLVFDAQVLEYHFSPIKDQDFDRLDVDYHGVFCSGTGGTACPFSYKWTTDQSAFGLIPDLSVFPTDHYLSLPLPSPLMSVFHTNDTVDLEQLPPPLKTRLLEEQEYCKTKGGSLYEVSNTAVPIPDLNDDGLQDWAYLGLSTSCQIIVDPETDGVDFVPADPTTQGNIIWLSSVKENEPVAWTQLNAPNDRNFALHIRADKSFSLVTFEELPENKNAEYPTCDIFALANCLITPIQLMSKQ